MHFLQTNLPDGPSAGGGDGCGVGNTAEASSVHEPEEVAAGCAVPP
jgi:hypothetical protein